MAWTASVLSKTKPKPDELVIVVRYTDGTNNLDESYTTRGGIPDLEWIEKTVRNKIKQLSALEVYVAPPVGPVTPAPDDTDPDPGFTSFMSDLRQFRRLWDWLVVTEIVPKTNVKVVAIQDSLKSRVATYIDRIN